MTIEWSKHIDDLISTLRLMKLILGLCETEKRTLEEAARILEKNKEHLEDETIYDGDE